MIKYCRFAVFTLIALTTLDLAANGGTPVDRYARWAQQRFNVTAAEFNAQFNRVGPSADPDGDGLTNLAEYALGTDPLSHSDYPGAVMMPIPNWGGSSLLTLSTTVRADDPNLILVPQVSEDGASWWPSLPYNVTSAPLDNFFAAQFYNGPVFSGMKAVQYAVLPNSPLQNPQFIRLAIVRFAAAAAAPGVPPNTPAPATQPGGSPAGAALAPLFSATPPIPGLLFTSQTSAALGAELLSNTLTLHGFGGWITVKAPPGVTLIVNGKAVAGSTAKVRAGYTLALKANVSKTSTTPITYTVKLANSTASWTVGGKQAVPVNAPAGSMAGYTPVNASVGQGGDANISIPITVSPGIAGMEPKLSINYNSGGGNGQLGIGFSLSGLSAITRIGANKAQDGFRGSVKLDANDRFALDGARLISITGADGANGTTYEKGITDFSRIQSFGTVGSGPASWKVETKSGLIFEYGLLNGTVEGSRLLLNGSVLAWYVSKISDLAGNEMHFHYARDGRTVYLQYIDYTFNVAGDVDSDCRVDFKYGKRPDPKTTYQMGQAFESNLRLVAIEATQNKHIVRHYDLEYQQAVYSGVSQLYQIREKGIEPSATGTSWAEFPSATFNWSPLPDAFSYARQPSPSGLEGTKFSPNRAQSRIIPADLNGDGITDLLVLNYGGNHATFLGNRQGGFTKVDDVGDFEGVEFRDNDKSRIEIGDFNADGRSDFIHFSSGGKHTLALSDGDGKFSTIKDVPTLGGNFSESYKTRFLLGDFDGDGRTDIIHTYVDEGGNPSNWVALSKGDGSFARQSNVSGLIKLTYSREEGKSQFFVADFNGDGLSDVLLLNYGGSHRLCLSKGDGTFTYSENLPGLNGKTFKENANSVLLVGDYNGDGLADVLHASSDGSYWLAFSKGDGTFDLLNSVPGLQGLKFPDFPDNDEGQLRTGDFNGDGLTDFFYGHYKGSYTVAFSNGDGSFTRQAGIPGLQGTKFIASADYSRVLPGDFNGDGITDIVILNCYKGDHFLALSAPSGMLVSQVINGHGGSTSFAYKPMTDASVYTKSNTAHYPVLNLQTPMYLVESKIVRNGVDGNPDGGAAGLQQTNRIRYDYSDVQIDLHGYGVQQAKMVTETDVTSGIVTKTWFGTKSPDGKADDPLLSGYPVKTEQSVMLNDKLRIISSTSTSWTKRDRSTLPNHRADHKTYFAFATSSVKRDYEINTGALTRQVSTSVPAARGLDDYDSNGNILTTSVTISPSSSNTDSGNFVETTVNTWRDVSAAGGKWLLGRLMTSQVTKTAPGGYRDTRHTSFDYDFARTGQLTKEVIEPGNTTPGITHTKTYHIDAFGNIDQSTESAWNGTGPATSVKSRNRYMIYSADHRFIEKTRNDLGHEETTLHEPLFGQVTDQEGPNKIKTHWDFDGFGRPIHEVRQDGTETRIWRLRATPGTKGAPARAVYGVTTQSTARPAQTIWYDVLDREIQRDAMGFDGRIVSARKVFNSRGELVQASDPFFAGAVPRYTVIDHDAISRVTRVVAPGNRVTITTYDGVSTSVTDPKNHVISRREFVTGKLQSSSDAHGRLVRHQYDGFGLLRTVSDEFGHVTTMMYDQRGQRLSIHEPNTGTAYTAYNGFGETILETTSDGKKTSHSYDSLGREALRVEPEGRTVWTFDTFNPKDANDGPARKSVGKLLRVTYPGYQQDVTYDYLGRPSLTTTRIAGGIFNTSASYDYTGRADSISYPTGFAVRNVYNRYAHLAEVRDANSETSTTPGALYWKATAVNERGQVVDEDLGNSVHTKRGYEPQTGRISTIRTGRGNAGLAEIQNLGFHFDAIGNLDSRTDTSYGLAESFGYDELYRLKGTHLDGATTGPLDSKIDYDDVGNITSRSEVGDYAYGENGLLPSLTKPAGPHAVTTLTGRPGGAPDLRYGYDLRGNRGRVDHAAGKSWVNDQRIAYTTANHPSVVIAGSAQSVFAYGPDRARIRQIQRVGRTLMVDRVYVDFLYERETRQRTDGLAGYVTRHIHYIPAGGGMVAIRQTEEGTGAIAERTLYLHKDHLGSIESISDGTGAPAEHLGYDAWGRRRTVGRQGTATQVAYTSATTEVPYTTSRGFTGHEMMDAFNLVHMNGRLFDPLPGRFLSADPLVQEIDNLQNLNRYSYVLNNPLTLTDPSGFAFSNNNVGTYLDTHANEYRIDFGNAYQQKIQYSNNLRNNNINVGTYGQVFTGTLLAGGNQGDALRASLSTGDFNVGGFGSGSQRAGFKFSDVATFIEKVENSAGPFSGGGKFANGAITAAYQYANSDQSHRSVSEGLKLDGDRAIDTLVYAIDDIGDARYFASRLNHPALSPSGSEITIGNWGTFSGDGHRYAWLEEVYTVRPGSEFMRDIEFQQSSIKYGANGHGLGGALTWTGQMLDLTENIERGPILKIGASILDIIDANHESNRLMQGREILPSKLWEVPK